MFSIPSDEEVITVASALGITLSSDEAELYQRHVVSQLEVLDEFVQSRLDESKPPIVSPEREPGYRPSSDEDPLHAWLWKCNIAGEGDDESLLAGKTVSFKDHTAVAGIPLTFNAYAMEGFIPDFDATVVTRVLEAGGTIIGKNTHDGFTGSLSLGSSNGDFQRPLNPHAADHVTGGSSSGSAAAIVAGEVDISFGGDQGGSIRIPSAWTGTVGLKPTFGLVSHFGVGFASEPSIDYTGPMARTVEDVARALQAVAGYDGLDPRQGREVPARIDVLSELDAGVDGLRIGILDEGFAAPIQTEVHDAVMNVTEVLADAGAKVTSISVPTHTRIDQILALYTEGGRAIFETGFFGAFARTYYPTSLIVAINRLWSNDADLLSPFTKLGHIVAEFSRSNYNGAVYAKAQNVRKAFIAGYDEALSEVDMLIMPTCISTAPKFQPAGDRLSALDHELGMLTVDRDGASKDISEMSVAELAVRNTMQFNYTGHPALSVPCGKANGLPIGFQLVGRFFEDALLLRAAAAFQNSVDWDDIIGLSAH